MAREEYREALSAAREDLRQVLADRAALDQRAGELKKIIDGLAVLCDETDHSSGIETGESLSGVGITDAIRSVLRDTEDPAMSPTEIRDELKKRGVKLDDYASEMTIIHNTLARLEKQNEVIKLSDPDGSPYAFSLRTGKFGTRVKESFARAVAETQERPKK
jgi:hypothetical protein